MLTGQSLGSPGCSCWRTTPPTLAPHPSRREVTPTSPPPGPRAAEPWPRPSSDVRTPPRGSGLLERSTLLSVAAGPDPQVLALFAGGGGRGAPIPQASPRAPCFRRGIHLPLPRSFPARAAAQWSRGLAQELAPRTHRPHRTLRPRAGPGPGGAPSRRSPAHRSAARPAAPRPAAAVPAPREGPHLPAPPPPRPRARSAHPPRRGRSRRGLRPGSEGGARGVGPRGRTEPAPRPQQPAFRSSAHPAARRLKGQVRLRSPPPGRHRRAAWGGRRRSRPVPDPAPCPISLLRGRQPPRSPRGLPLSPAATSSRRAPAPPTACGVRPVWSPRSPLPLRYGPWRVTRPFWRGSTPVPTQPCLPVLTGCGLALALGVGAADQALRLSPSLTPDSVAL